MHSEGACSLEWGQTEGAAVASWTTGDGREVPEWCGEKMEGERGRGLRGQGLDRGQGTRRMAVGGGGAGTDENFLEKYIF